LTFLLGWVSELLAICYPIVHNFRFLKGWATDLKTVSEEMINKRALRTGDGTRKTTSNSKVTIDANEFVEPAHDLWGWGNYAQLYDVH